MMRKHNEIVDRDPPKSINCLTSCRFQDDYNQMSNPPFPQKQMFFYQKTFCNVASHVLQVTCQEPLDGNRRFFIEKSHPNICNVLEDFDKFFGSNSTCNEWPKNFFEDLEEGDKPNSTLNDELFEYGKQNLALIHVMMQSPYTTKIKRDVAMTFTNYVANTGGLLGLCLGFSFISFIEIIVWCCFCVKELRKWPVSTTWITLSINRSDILRCQFTPLYKIIIVKLTCQAFFHCTFPE